MTIHDLLFSANVDQLSQLLSDNPSLVNAEIALRDNPATAHPLHRICDGVFNGDYSEQTGIALAKVFINHGAKVNTGNEPGKDSPLTAACSLYCDALALFYIDQGARIDHRGCHGGTALHWASWCGRDVVVKKLVALRPDINQLCTDFKSTPLFWTIHGYKSGGKNNIHRQLNCARILLEHGADPSIPNIDGKLPEQLLQAGDSEFIELFKKQ